MASSKALSATLTKRLSQMWLSVRLTTGHGLDISGFNVKHFVELIIGVFLQAFAVHPSFLGKWFQSTN